MNVNNVINRAKEKKLAAEKRLAELRANAAMLQKEIEQWDTFVLQWEKLSREERGGKPDKQTSRIRLRKDSLPAFLAFLLNDAEEHTMQVSALAAKLKDNGKVTSENVVNITYSTLNRRGDLFEKVRPGVFKLKTLDFEIVE